MANGAAFYKFTDEKLGLSSQGALAGATNVPLWNTLVGTTPAVGTLAQNGGFLLKCSVSGACAANGVGPTPQYLTDNAATWVLTGAAQPGQSGVSPLCGADYLADPITGIVQRHELGLVCLAKDFGPNDYGIGEFMYVKFTGATDIVAGDFVQVNRASKTATQSPTALASANSPVPVGIAMANHKLSATTPSYGWIMIRGVHDGANVTTGGTAGCCCSLGAAAGRVLGTGYVVNKSIEAAFLLAAAANNVGTVELYWPMASGR